VWSAARTAEQPPAAHLHQRSAWEVAACVPPRADRPCNGVLRNPRRLESSANSRPAPELTVVSVTVCTS